MRNQGRRQPRRKLGVKYCGGCAPTYDRVAALGRIREALCDSWELVSWEDDGADHILVVAGCKTACVDPTPFEQKPVYWLTSEDGEPELIETLRLAADRSATA